PQGLTCRLGAPASDRQVVASATMSGVKLTNTENVHDEVLQSLARGLHVIREFNSSSTEMTLSDVARRAELTRASTRRILRTLEQLGYVVQVDRKFSLTPQVLELGYAYLSSQPLNVLGLPLLQRLSQLTDESTSIGVLDGHDLVYTA